MDSPDPFKISFIIVIRKPGALKLFDKRVTSYEPQTVVESFLAQAAKQALALYRQFPSSSFMDYLPTVLDGEEDQDYYENETCASSALIF